ncbi:MAG: hypothetical protein V1887_02500 [Candidatus Aenigmatarchaeota archaeon]
MQFRKIVALGGAALMAGMSFAMPTLAAITNVADIGNMAGVTGTAANFPTFIVGADAKTSDVAAAINLASYMAGNVYTTSSVSFSGSAAGANGVTLREELGYTLAKTKDFDLTSSLVITPATRSGRSASFLKDTSISVGSTSYNYFEEIVLNGAQSTSYWNLTCIDTSTSTTYETGKKDIGLYVPATTNAANLQYRIIFDTALPFLGSNLTGQSLTFLGQEYTVTGTPTASGGGPNELRLSPSAGAQFVAYQQSATIAGYTVKVIAIGTASTDKVGLEITKNGQSTTVSIAQGGSQTVTVGGSTTTIGISSTTPGTGGGAQITVGTAAMVLRNGAEIKDTSGKVLYPGWQIALGGTTEGITHINLTNTRAHNSPTGDTPLLIPGASIAAPTGYFELKNVGIEERSKYKIVVSAVQQSNINDDVTGNENGIKVEAKDGATDSLVKVIDTGSAFTDTIAWDNTNLRWVYYNSSSQWSPFTTGATTINLPLTDGNLGFKAYNSTPESDGSFLAPTTANANVTLYINEPTLSESTNVGRWYVEFHDKATDGAKFSDLGTSSGSTDAYTYLSYSKDSVAQGLWDSSNTKVRTTYVSSYGTDLLSGSQTEIDLAVPKAQNYWDIVFGLSSGSASTGGSAVSKNPVRITGDVAVLDTEVTDFAQMTSDMVVVGGPAINKAAATLLGVTYPAHGASSGITADTAMVRVFQNAFSSGHVAVLIAGYEAQNTDMATAVIQAGKLTQTVPKVQISGSVSSPVIEAVA